MAQQIFAFKVAVPAGTAISAPTSTSCAFAQATVQAIEIVIPDGHAGLTGLALAQAHQQIIPQNLGQWIISNDEKLTFPVEDYGNNGDWQAIAYNTDVYDHNFYLRFLCADITPPPAGLLNPATAALAVSPDLSSPTPDAGVALAPADVPAAA